MYDPLFEWDEAKAAINFRKHQVGFTEGATVFNDEFIATMPDPAHSEDGLRPEYDFSNALRGKHHKPMHQGYSVEVHKDDGTTVIEHYQVAEGTVMLQPDVRAYFPDSESVNKALRSLITLMAELPETGKRAGSA